MNRLCAWLLAPLLIALWAMPANASGDYSCTPSWKLAHNSLSECDNIAILSPGNDSRVNLLMLMIDRRGKADAGAWGKPAAPMRPLFDWRTFATLFSPVRPDGSPTDFAEGEGSRCRSNATGSQAFEAAVRAATKLEAGESEKLIGARKAIQPTCAGTSAGDGALAGMTGAIRSRDGLAFATYLRGALAFYDGDFDAAAAHFAALHSASIPWLKETARYMIARVEVNRAQVGAFDEYGDWNGADHVDQKVIDAAEAGLLHYVQDYPHGLYTLSARGLLRRVYWLGGRTDKLAAQYVALFAQDPQARGISESELAQEVDNKMPETVPSGGATDPILLAVTDLKRMRPCEGCSRPQIGLAELESQRSRFSGTSALFDYLLAAHAFYVTNRPAEVLRLIPEARPAKHLSYLEFSRQMLRRMAADKTGSRIGAGDWLTLLPAATLPWQSQAVELALAMQYERDKMVGRVFETGSPIRSAVVRETLLAKIADARLLRLQARDPAAPAHERELALFILLYKELTRGAYRDFLADLALVPAGQQQQGSPYDVIEAEHVPVAMFVQDIGSENFDCPPLKTVATRLSANPGEAKARLCLADFMRANGFDQAELDQQPPADELGGTPSLFPAEPYSRLEVYKSIMADPKAAAAEKAYALYRAVHCYGPTGNNSCGGTEVPVGQRRTWFQRLKKDFPTTPWAKELKYYW